MAVVMLALSGLPGAAAACRVALALGLDVSGSVDGSEYRLQMDGLAAALLRPEVQAALLALPGDPVELMVFEWSGPNDQRVVQPWQPVADAAAIAAIAGQLRATLRGSGDPSTALGSAMRAGAAELKTRGHCTRKVLDLSGDGPSNTGPLPHVIRDSAELSDVTVNGLVIAPEGPVEATRGAAGQAALEGYFQAYVIRGPGAFTEAAAGFDDYEDAMARKLIRELQGLVLTRADLPGGTQQRPARLHQ
ncbi:DUF1194 domain-containing protein [Thalassovita gelatinovora]|nr:DUF1194 domain-containing protein [Thalassovita gelatinovora]